MMQITLVTGNAGKLAEWQAIFPADIKLTSKSLDLIELQSLDLNEILEAKVKAAYALLKAPLIVEDASLEIDNINKLPGPFVKFFMDKDRGLGNDAPWILAGYKPSAGRAICSAAYYNGKELIISRGVAEGTIVKPRGERGFGFDYALMPSGYDQTFAEMPLQMKNTLSHRALAIKDLVEKLKATIEI